jgi:hypothetical protein
MGPTTASWIRKFQNDAKASGSNILVDGRVDRALGQVASVSKTVYSILLMNFALHKKNPAAYKNLPQAVPLNPNPRSNPYNPKPGAKPRRPINVVVFHWTQPKRVFVAFDDGSFENYVVEGKFFIDGYQWA